MDKLEEIPDVTRVCDLPAYPRCIIGLTTYVS